VSALFSGLMVNLGVVVMARLSLQIYGPSSARPLLGLLTTLGAASAVLGAVMALAQDDLKRLLAYDTVSQMGVLLVGFSAAHPPAVAGATYHLINHAVFKALLFLCAGAIVHATGFTHLSEMGALARRLPLVAAAFVLGVLAISGIPPLNGYVSLGLIHDSLKDHNPAAYAALIAAQVITVAALSRAAYLAFFVRREEKLPKHNPMHPGMVTTMGILGAGCIAFGVLPYAVLHRIVEPATGGLLAAGTYANGLLNQGGTGLPIPSIEFSYFSPAGLVTALGTAAAGVVLAVWYVRRTTEPKPVSWLRALHTGSVNDYAAYLAVGSIITIGSLLAR
jgi:multicomponent Na+:H+ antiporter subunit D